MKLIADSGSTKTDWCLFDINDKVKSRLATQGINPFHMSEDTILGIIRDELLPQLDSVCSSIEEIEFYGAGCTVAKIPVMKALLSEVFPSAKNVVVGSDMLGAARGICGHEPGIACILGTGSNSCSYDGKNLVKNVSPLGFILGDEGSGAVLGKLLLGDILKNQMPQHIIKRFFEKYNTTQAEIIDKVYRQPKPNTFLASFVPFLEENIEEPAIYALVLNSFRSFLQRNVKQYENWDKLPIGFNGSIAHFYRKPLEEALKLEGMNLGRIVQAPMAALVEYHA